MTVIIKSFPFFAVRERQMGQNCPNGTCTGKLVHRKCTGNIRRLQKNSLLEIFSRDHLTLIVAKIRLMSLLLKFKRYAQKCTLMRFILSITDITMRPQALILSKKAQISSESSPKTVWPHLHPDLRANVNQDGNAAIAVFAASLVLVLTFAITVQLSILTCTSRHLRNPYPFRQQWVPCDSLLGSPRGRHLL